MSSIDLGPFVLKEPIGRGGMGEVWAGRHRHHDVDVAVKVIAARYTEKTRYRKALRREIRAMARLDHPGVVRIFDDGVVGAEAAHQSRGALVEGSPYFVMERLAVLPYPSTLRWFELKRVVLSLLDALAHVHARGVLHSDIKPSNVLCSGERVVLTDFGVARLPTLSDPSRVAGTPAYMPLELLEGRTDALGPWTDVYMVGALAVTLATGAPPYGNHRSPAALREAMLAGPPRLEDAPHPMPGELQAWLERALNARPEARFRFAAHAVRALLEIPAPPGDVGLGSGDRVAPAKSVLETLSVLESVCLFEHAAPLPASAPSPVEGLHPLTTLPDDWREPRHPAWSWSPLIEASPTLFPLRVYPLVGRERERDALWRATHEALREQTSRLVMIRGDLGMGKTRLLQWWHERLHELGGVDVRWLYHEPLAPRGDALRALLGRVVQWNPRDPDASSVRLRSQLQSMNRVEEFAILEALLEVRDGAPHHHLSERARHAAALRLLTGVVEARGQALCALAIDDAQWGSDSLRFARLLLEARADRPTVVVVAVRDPLLDDDVAHLLAEFDDREHARALTLAPLSARALVRLSSMLNLDPRAARRLETSSAGNPSALIETLNHAIRHDELLATPEGYVIETTPRELRSLWSARIEDALDQLPQVAASVLAGAALLGQELRSSEWSALCAREGAPEERLLEACIRLGLLRERDEGWVFSHHALRDGLRERIPPERLPELHRFLASVLESSALDGRRSQLAIHLWEAGERARAVPLLFDVIWEEHQRGDHREALISLEALSAYLEDLALEPRHPWRVEALALETTLNLFLSRMEALEVSLTRLDAARAGYPRWEALHDHVRGAQMHESGRPDEARVCFDRALSVCEAHRDQPWEAQLTGRTLLGLADVVLEQGDHAASHDLGRAAAQAFERAGDLTGVSVTLLRLAQSMLTRGQLDEADGLHERAEAAMPASDLRHQSDLMMFKGELARARGAHREALRWYQKAHDANASMGYVVANSLMLVNMGLAWSALDEFPVAVELFERARLRFIELGSPLRVALVQACMLKSLAGIADWDRLARYLVDVQVHSAALADPDVLQSIDGAARIASASNRDALAQPLIELAGVLRSRLPQTA